MKLPARIAILLVLASSLRAQDTPKVFLKNSGFNLQFAGSTGFLSAGMFRTLAKEKIDLGLMYGHTPRALGGPLHSVTVKFLYDPFTFKIGKKFSFQPIQPGVFMCQTFGKELPTMWPLSQYPPFYYWWPRNLRVHPLLSSSVSWKHQKVKWLQRTTLYFEANTNDLYIASFTIKSNHRSLSLYDIIFFGAGLKVYL